MERVGPSPGQGCWAFRVALALKNPPANGGDVRDTGSAPGLGRLPWRKAWQSTLVFLPGDSHGQSLVSYGLWGHTDWSNLTFTQDGSDALTKQEICWTHKASCQHMASVGPLKLALGIWSMSRTLMDWESLTSQGEVVLREAAGRPYPESVFLWCLHEEGKPDQETKKKFLLLPNSAITWLGL